MDSWMQEKEGLRQEMEEMRMRMELNEARTKKTKEVVTLDPLATSNNKREGSFVGSVVGASKMTQEVDSSRTIGEYRRLSSAEIKEKREKRLCFRCDEPFSREHRCKNKQLRMLLLAEEDEVEEERVVEVEIQ
ncbi:hypothetical protein Lal_00033459 [Lupinus albus]|nr:hypothetical protein Lal_00033459 [Lupinus albus]